MSCFFFYTYIICLYSWNVRHDRRPSWPDITRLTAPLLSARHTPSDTGSQAASASAGSYK